MTNIKQLFKKSPVPVNPIVFDMRIPSSLQRANYRAFSEAGADVDKFTMVYDGYIMMVAGVCPHHKRPWGVYDARDRFRELLKAIDELEMISPCLTHQAIVFSKSELEKTERFNDVYLPIPTDVDADVLGILRTLYVELNEGLHIFYSNCSTANRMDETAEEMLDSQTKLTGELRKFMLTEWHKIRQKREIIKEIRVECVELLDKFAEHSLQMQEISRGRVKLQEEIAHSELLEALVQRVQETEKYAEPDLTVDIDTLMRVVEHVREEIGTYSVNFSTVVSALIGAVIGSTLTLIASYWLGILS